MTKREMILRGLTDNELKAALIQLEEDKEREKDATKRAKMEPFIFFIDYQIRID